MEILWVETITSFGTMEVLWVETVPSCGTMGVLWVETVLSCGTMEVLWVETIISFGTTGVLWVETIISFGTFEGKPDAAEGLARYSHPDADGRRFAPKGWANSPTFARRRWKRRIG